MRDLLLATIYLYWKWIPTSKRKRCLFKRSCSHYVYDITIKRGFISGIKALRYRFLNCRKGYTIIEVSSQTVLISANNNVFIQEEIDPRLLSNNELLQDEPI